MTNLLDESLLGPFPLHQIDGTATMGGANRAATVRCQARKTGTLSAIYFCVAIQDGNMDVAVLDGHTSPRNRLWSSGSFAVPAPGWQDGGNPAVAVTAGFWYDLAISSDSATASFAKATGHAASHQGIPATLMPVSPASADLTSNPNTSHPIPATLDVGAAAAIGNVIGIFGVIS